MILKLPHLQQFTSAITPHRLLQHYTNVVWHPMIQLNIYSFDIFKHILHTSTIATVNDSWQLLLCMSVLSLSTLTQIASLLASTQSRFRLQAKAFALSVRRTRISSEVDMWLWRPGKGKQIISVSVFKVISITVSVSFFMRSFLYVSSISLPNWVVTGLKIFSVLVSVWFLLISIISVSVWVSVTGISLVYMTH